MKIRTFLRRIGLKRAAVMAVAILLLIAASACSVSLVEEKPVVTAPLKITFIDVGQGDSILVQCGGQNLLIDAGTTESAGQVIRTLEENKVQKIDVLVGTHPHEDHIGSMDKVIDQFDIGQIYMPKVTANTHAFKDVVTAVKNKGMKVTAPVAGSTFELGEATCTILAPNSKSYEEINNYSIVLRLVFGNTSYLFMGDAESLSEQEILDSQVNLRSDVLKIGHHGSNSSTSADFLEAVSPEAAVISCAEGNDYKHPHKETVNRLKKAGIPIYRTDENGTVVCTSDGKSFRFDVEPGSYKSGDGK